MTVAWSDGGTFTASLGTGQTIVNLLTLPAGMASAPGNVMQVLGSYFDHGFVDQGVSPSLGGTLEFVDVLATVWPANITGTSGGGLPIVISDSLHQMVGGVVNTGFNEAAGFMTPGTLNGGGTIRLRITGVVTSCSVRGSVAAFINAESDTSAPIPIGTVVNLFSANPSGTFVPTTPSGKTSQGWFARASGVEYDGNTLIAGTASTPSFDGADTWQNVKVQTNGGTWVGFGALPDVVDGITRSYAFHLDASGPVDAGRSIYQLVSSAAVGRKRSSAQVIG